MSRTSEQLIISGSEDEEQQCDEDGAPLSFAKTIQLANQLNRKPKYPNKGVTFTQEQLNHLQFEFKNDPQLWDTKKQIVISQKHGLHSILYKVRWWNEMKVKTFSTLGYNDNYITPRQKALLKGQFSRNKDLWSAKIIAKLQGYTGLTEQQISDWLMQKRYKHLNYHYIQSGVGGVQCKLDENGAIDQTVVDRLDLWTERARNKFNNWQMAELAQEFKTDPTLWQTSKLLRIAKHLFLDASLIQIWNNNQMQQCKAKYSAIDYDYKQQDNAILQKHYQGTIWSEEQMNELATETGLRPCEVKYWVERRVYVDALKGKPPAVIPIFNTKQEINDFSNNVLARYGLEISLEQLKQAAEQCAFSAETMSFQIKLAMQQSFPEQELKVKDYFQDKYRLLYELMQGDSREFDVDSIKIYAESTGLTIQQVSEKLHGKYKVKQAQTTTYMLSSYAKRCLLNERMSDLFESKLKQANFKPVVNNHLELASDPNKYRAFKLFCEDKKELIFEYAEYKQWNRKYMAEQMWLLLDKRMREHYWKKARRLLKLNLNLPEPKKDTNSMQDWLNKLVEANDDK